MLNKFTMLAFLSVFAVYQPFLSAGSPNSRFSVTSRFNDAWNANSKSGEVGIELRELRVDAAGPSGKPLQERIVLLFEPKSGAYSWYAIGDYWPEADTPRQMQILKGECAVFFQDQSLVVFMGGISPKLYIRDFQGHASDMDDAETKALSLAAELHTPPDKEDEEKTWHVVRMTSLNRDFVTPPESPVGGPTPKVTEVQWDKDSERWSVTLQARWTAVVTLDAKYNEISAQKLE